MSALSLLALAALLAPPPASAPDAAEPLVSMADTLTLRVVGAYRAVDAEARRVDGPRDLYLTAQAEMDGAKAQVKALKAGATLEVYRAQAVMPYGDNPSKKMWIKVGELEITEIRGPVVVAREKPGGARSPDLTRPGVMIKDHARPKISPPPKRKEVKITPKPKPAPKPKAAKKKPPPPRPRYTRPNSRYSL